MIKQEHTYLGADGLAILHGFVDEPGRGIFPSRQYSWYEKTF